MKQLQVVYDQEQKVYVAGPATAGASAMTVQAVFDSDEPVFMKVESQLHPQMGWYYRCSATSTAGRISLIARNLAEGEQVRAVLNREPLSVLCADVNGGGSGSGTAAPSDIQKLQAEIEELKGTGNSEAAASPELDSQNEMTDFLKGYTNEDTLQKVIEDNTKLASSDDVVNMFNA